EAQEPKERQKFEGRMVGALKRMPPLPANADTATAQMYLAAQLEQGNLLYGAAIDLAQKGDTAAALKKFAELDVFRARFKQTYDRHSRQFREEAQGEFERALRQLKAHTRYGLAQAEYRAGNYDSVLAPRATGEVVEEVKKLGQSGGPIKM